MSENKVKIGVIGAGLSGLTAARQLLNQNPNAHITVFESNDRVGGRTYTIHVDGNHYDMGASFIGKTQVDVIELANEAKNELIPQYETGKKVMDLENQVSTYSSTIPNNVNIFSLIKMQWVLFKINRMAKKVSVENPNLCLNAAIWDSMTLNSWISQNSSNEKVKKMVEAAIRVIYGAELSELSFLYFLWYVHQSENFDNLVNIENGLQEKKLKLGTQQLSEYLSEEIKSKGGEILLSTKVEKVSQLNEKCYVETKEEKYEFDYFIVAIPPPNVEKIEFEPQLSRDRRHLCSRSFMGSIGKMIIRYKEAYWKNKGFSGEILSDGFDSPITLTYDDSKSKDNGEVQAALIVFIGGAVYRHWIEDEEKMKAAVLKKLSLYFQEPKMIEPLSIHYERWETNKTINGGPVACFPPGLLSLVEELRKPEGRIHWAGTELARRSCGFMDGAIESGKRVSEEILKLIDAKEKLTLNLEANQKENKSETTHLYTKSTKKHPFIEWW